MEVWLRSVHGSKVASVDGIDRVFGLTPHDSNLHVKDTTLFQGSNVMGAYVQFETVQPNKRASLIWERSTGFLWNVKRGQ